MPSFKPTRDYLLKLTEELIDNHGVSGRFLEIGCGDGAISTMLAKRGWHGLAMDLSDESEHFVCQQINKENMQDRVTFLKANFFDYPENEKFNIIFLYDVLEHVKEDILFLNKVRSSLADGGHLFLSVPVKMNEWRWDDDNYGHIQRYEYQALSKMLDTPSSGFKILEQWDITFPALWLMRRVYLFLVPPPANLENTPIETRTENSAFTNVGKKSLMIRIAESLPIWRLAFWLQDRFRNRRFGCNTLILAQAIPQEKE